VYVKFFLKKKKIYFLTIQKRAKQMDKYSILKKYFGYTSFRKGQEEIVDALLNGQDVIGVMPTGSGKSICYQIPAMLLNGITLVISPLISLMKDQVTNLNQSGIPTCFINSSQNFSEQISLFDAIKYGEYKIVYIAPERLSTSSFINLCQNIHIAMIAVDEAHCISQWGQDFRPSYLNICDFIEKLPYRPQIGAFTATATEQVKKDISDILKLRNPHVTTTGFDRPNLYFSSVNSQSKFKDMIKIIKQYEDCSGIIYCSTRKNVDSITERLQKIGVDAVAYHAGLSEEERRKNQDDFIYDNVKIIVATNAFGMGIDKSNVSYIIHYNMPKDLESYYQEAGRAGRDGSNAQCYLLYSKSDYKLNLFILKKSYEDGNSTDDILKKNIKKLGKMWDYATYDYCLRYKMLNYFGDKAPNYCGNCSNCNSKYKESDVTIQAQKILSCIYRIAQRKKYVGKSTLTKILKGRATEKIISMKLDTISTFGLLSDEPEEKIKQIINNLIISDYIGTTDGDMCVLYLKKSSAEVIKGNKKIMFRFPDNQIETFINHSNEKLSTKDPVLLNILKELRFKLAEEEHVPAYAVFTDKILYEMADVKPETIEDFEKISGIGKIRSEKYGFDFTNAIKKYNSSHSVHKN
jgi:ATP-dependent DNA helicase RecQ